ncbi:hypothetical protein DY000_02010383 [Brassica cretica]|uniref:Jacalin-type lectin domain-containing protein n=1 Tax=Brassica cretica TaxID=69181 RepID=A0ABQ7C4A0_BRACR|nr:hypothetical protein DY000_02010383 [Brassica cretica]
MPQKLEARGGNGGNQWDDGAEHEGVSKIYIREGRDGIESIKFDYILRRENLKMDQSIVARVKVSPSLYKFKLSFI